MSINWKTHWWYLKTAKIWKVVLVVALIIVASIFLSLHFGSWEHISRCGGIITIIGAYLTAWPLVKLGPHGATSEPPPMRINTNQFNPEFPEYKTNQIMAVYIQIIGVIVLILGTFLWSYGDFILNLIIPMST